MEFSQQSVARKTIKRADAPEPVRFAQRKIPGKFSKLNTTALIAAVQLGRAIRRRLSRWTGAERFGNALAGRYDERET
jgi:hypothetical protein